MQPDEEAELDPVVFGPAAQPARPARAAAPRPPRPAPRRKGPVETGVSADLKAFAFEVAPPIVKELTHFHPSLVGVVAQTVHDINGPRDAAGHAREIRQATVTLADLAPGEGRGDQTDEVRDRRERRLRAGGE